jgi:hypothetical protein
MYSRYFSRFIPQEESHWRQNDPLEKEEEV